jgi:hypothetical protein
MRTLLTLLNAISKAGTFFLIACFTVVALASMTPDICPEFD